VLVAARVGAEGLHFFQVDDVVNVQHFVHRLHVLGFHQSVDFIFYVDWDRGFELLLREELLDLYLLKLGPSLVFELELGGLLTLIVLVIGVFVEVRVQVRVGVSRELFQVLCFELLHSLVSNEGIVVNDDRARPLRRSRHVIAVVQDSLVVQI